MNDYVQIDIGYGHGQQHLKLPRRNLLSLAIPPRSIKPAENDIAELRRSIDNPIGASRLRDIARSGRTAVIIVSDHTRPTPSHKIIPFLLEELALGGIEIQNITVLFATGTHRPTRPDEMKRILGEDLFSRLRSLSHDCDDSENLVLLGASSRGTPIEVNRAAVEADIRICVNTLEPHQSAGWSGGAKNIMPGISSRRSVFIHHSQCKLPGVGIGRIEGNPFKEDLNEIGETFGVHFCVDVLLDEKHRLVRSFAGDLIQANRAGALYAEELLCVPLPRTPDIIVGGIGGAPRDNTLWQAEGKILSRISPVVRQGGVAVLVAECAEGFGDSRFETVLNSGSPSQIIEDFDKQEFSVLGNKAFRMCRLMEKASLFFVTGGIGADRLKAMPISFFSGLQQAVDEALQKLGPDSSIVVVPNAASVLLRAAE